MNVRRLAVLVAAGVLSAGIARAGGGPETGVGLWAVLFLALGAAVILTQALPALVLFASMIRGLFRSPERDVRAERRG